jgi:hypothetical protein
MSDAGNEVPRSQVSHPIDPPVLEGVRIFELPPEGFDALEAPEESLQRYGFPRRPDPKTEPELARLFKRAFSRPRSFLTPDLVVDPELTRLLGERRNQPGFSSGNWGGAVVPTSAKTPPNLAFAQFAVPTVLDVDPSVGVFQTEVLTAGFWVGIGGYNGSKSLLQAGIGVTVTVEPGLAPFVPNRSSVSYWAWTEWWTNGYKVSNLEVFAGDVVSVLVCAPQPSNGFVMMENLRTDEIVSVGVSPPGAATANGPSAEWIVEALSARTPRFTPITFFDCTAGSQNTTLTLTGATTVDMPGVAGNEVNATIVSPSSVTVQWEAFQ